MKLLIIYRSAHGQTARIAEYIAGLLRTEGEHVEVLDGRTVSPGFDLARYAAVMVGAPVQAGQFPRYIREFVVRHRAHLQRIPSAFFSVCLTEADPDPRGHARALNPTYRLLKRTGWQPGLVASFAGSIAYMRHRWLMRLIWPHLALPEAPKEGDRPLSDRDYEYTDWQAVARFAREFMEMVRVSPPMHAPVADTGPQGAEQQLNASRPTAVCDAGRPSSRRERRRAMWWQNLLWGIWNGLSAWIILIAHVFGGWTEYPFYNETRGGNWYDFGFLIGAGSPFLGMLGRGRTRQKVVAVETPVPVRADEPGAR